MRQIRLRSSHRPRRLRSSHRQRGHWTPPPKDEDLLFEQDLLPQPRKKRKRKK